MLPRPTPPLDPHRGTDRRTPGRVLSVVLALAVLTGLPGLAGAPTAAAGTAPAAPPAVSLSVVAGPVRGGTSVDLSGPGVGATTTVWFGSVAVTAITHVSATRV